ncbi:response regulator transcription factor [Granulicella sp. L60]|uniref:response regulator n=1 Tax=Granulicella sp. L60 TaxID=1641866 RepID=UPI00131DC8C2|nr:response regulator transcription factor [Granulicella sp. L60]
MAELKILIADDHDLIRRGLRGLLATQSEWQVVGEVSNGIDAIEMAVRLRPDIAILDFSMPQLNGPAAAAQIAEMAPEIRVIVLTMHDSEQVIREVLQAGAHGFVLKSDADRDLVAAIEAVARNRHFFADWVSELVPMECLTRCITPKIKRTGTSLTEREREIMRLLAHGMTSKAAAIQLQISMRTVESHRINISRKLGLGSIADLVRYAIRNGIIARN